MENIAERTRRFMEALQAMEKPDEGGRIAVGTTYTNFTDIDEMPRDVHLAMSAGFMKRVTELAAATRDLLSGTPMEIVTLNLGRVSGIEVAFDDAPKGDGKIHCLSSWDDANKFIEKTTGDEVVTMDWVEVAVSGRVTIVSYGQEEGRAEIGFGNVLDPNNVYRKDFREALEREPETLPDTGEDAQTGIRP